MTKDNVKIEQKEAKLTYVAKTGGIKINDQDEWINPTEEAKDHVIKRLDELKAHTGKKVLLFMSGTKYYSNIVILLGDQEIKEEEVEDKPEEEKVEANKKDQVKTTAPIKEDTSNQEVSPFGLQGKEREYFNELNEITCQTHTKGNLLYVSWAEAWEKLKQKHPEANFKVYENGDGMPYFADQTGGMVKVGVTILGIEHVVWLPIMNHMNKTIPRSQITTFDINTAIQRAFTKSMALHGMALRIYK